MELGDNSYRRLHEIKSHNENVKRFFGKDITNLEKRGFKNISIFEKPTNLAKVETKTRSNSVFGRKEKAPQLPLKDPLGDYKQSILDFMVDLEKVEPLDIQKNITQKMRMILVDWLVDVHESFELKEQTLYLALSYLADYSSLRDITKDDYQLVGITSLWIASKYEQIYPPSTKNYIEVTADSYKIKDLKNMEGSIIEALRFNMNRTTPLALLQALTEGNEAFTDKSISLCKYALELALFEGLGKKYTPYTMVMAAIKLAENILSVKGTLKMQPNCKSNGKVVECFKDICILMQQENKYGLTAIVRKYAKAKNHQVSKIKLTLSQ